MAEVERTRNEVIYKREITTDEPNAHAELILKVDGLPEEALDILRKKSSPALADSPIIAEDHNTEKEEADMAAVEMKDKKKEMIEKTAQEFQKLNGDNQMFILGYMLGIQQERQRTTPQPQTA